MFNACPFCGKGERIGLWSEQKAGDPAVFYVSCGHCGARGPYAARLHPMRESEQAVRATAERRWNQRVSLQENQVA
jgi:Lar family restriction alleviation protein